MKVGTLLVAAMVAVGVGRAVAAAGDLGNPGKALSTMSRARIEHAKKSYLTSLESPTQGVVQSAIGIILQWRLISPGEDLSKCEQKIKELAINGATPTIRFKASLASLVMDNPTLVNINVASCDDCGELFDAVTASVRQMVIAHRLH